MEHTPALETLPATKNNVMPVIKTTEKKKKKKVRRVFRYHNVDRLGDLKLVDYFFWRGVWRKVQWADDADLLFHVLEHNISWSEVRGGIVNKIPGVTVLSQKQEHAYAFKLYNRYNQGTVSEELGFPETYILPQEYSAYKRAHESNKGSVYLTKTNTGSQGSGIIMLTSPSQLTMSMDDLIVQRYISKPYLVRGLKHDMRIYVVLTGVEPLRAYIHKEGLIRFCTEPYQEPTSQIIKLFNNKVRIYSSNPHPPAKITTERINQLNL